MTHLREGRVNLFQYACGKGVMGWVTEEEQADLHVVQILPWLIPSNHVSIHLSSLAELPDIPSPRQRCPAPITLPHFVSFKILATVRIA